MWRMAGMTHTALLAGRSSLILDLSLRRAPNPPPSDPASRRRIWIDSPPSIPVHPAERFPPPLRFALTIDLASALSSAPSSDGAFFLPVCPAAASRGNAPAYLVDRLSLCLTHSSYSLFRVALTDRAIYISPCRCDAVRFLLPRTCVARHRVQAVSSSLGLGPPGPAHLLLPCAGPLLAIWLRPYPRPHLRMGPFFLPHPLGRSLGRQHWPAPR